MRRIYRPFASSWCRIRPTTTTVRWSSTSLPLRNAEIEPTVKTKPTEDTTDTAPTEDLLSEKNLAAMVYEPASDEQNLSPSYTEEQLLAVREQMKMNIKQYKADNMAVRLNKPRPDLTKKMGVTVKHTLGETKHSQLFRSHLDDEPTVESFITVCEVFKTKTKSMRQVGRPK